MAKHRKTGLLFATAIATFAANSVANAALLMEAEAIAKQDDQVLGGDAPAKTKSTLSDDEKQPETAIEIARALGVSDDDRRPEDQLRVNILGKPMIIGGEVGSSFQYRGGYALTPGADDDDARIEPELKIETLWQLRDDLVTFTDVKLFGESTIYKQGGRSDHTAGVELSEAWILKTGLFGTPLALQLGRQQVQDRREWWWDEDLDMVRVHYFGKKVSGFVGMGRELGYYSTLGRRDPEDRDILRFMGNAKWDWADRQEIQVYGLHQNDRSSRYNLGAIIDENRFDEADAKLSWAGLRVRGRVKAKIPGKFYYWGDLAFVMGRETSYDSTTLPNDRERITGRSREKVRGWAYDFGASFELPFAFKPYLTVGLARGSGGKRKFRQTGLHGNNGKFRGNSRFRYYGEVLRPDLSNMQIATAALGIPIGEDGWIETVWHRYRQPTPNDRIAGSRLDIDPLGSSGRIGNELDIIASYRPKSGWDFELTGGAFRAGPAFGSEQGRKAWLIEMKASKNF
jgi:alginate production protein